MLVSVRLALGPFESGGKLLYGVDLSTRMAACLPHFPCLLC